MIHIVVIARHEHYARLQFKVLGIIQVSIDTSSTRCTEALETLNSVE